MLSLQPSKHNMSGSTSKLDEYGHVTSRTITSARTTCHYAEAQEVSDYVRHAQTTFSRCLVLRHMVYMQKSHRPSHPHVELDSSLPDTSGAISSQYRLVQPMGIGNNLASILDILMALLQPTFRMVVVAECVWHARIALHGHWRTSSLQ